MRGKRQLPSYLAIYMKGYFSLEIIDQNLKNISLRLFSKVIETLHWMQKMSFVSKFLHFGYELQAANGLEQQQKTSTIIPSIKFLRDREMEFEESLRNDRK